MDERDPDAVRGLEELEVVSPEFLRRFRAKLDRRQTSADLLGFCWHVPRTVLFELLGTRHPARKKEGKQP